jgi:lysophospholipase L1-like esterase
MQNLILYHLVSGHVWFVCGFLFLVIILQDLRGVFLHKPLLRAVVRLLLLALMPLAALSGTPLPFLLALLLTVVAAAYVLVGFSSTAAWMRFLLGGATAGLTVAALVREAPYHFPQAPSGGPPKRLYIIGDSLAAGMGGEKLTWPKKLREITRIEITDLSFAGANAGSAHPRQASIVKSESDPEAWVLISIGGNDMLGRTNPEDFGKHLDELLATVRGDASAPRTVLMLELPIIPGAWAFASWQRELAAKYDVVLIPKRLLAGIVLTEANVVDGLHLSRLGHERMAEQLAPWLGAP